MLSDRERRFLDACQGRHLATADQLARSPRRAGVLRDAGDTLYITIDEKPKRASARRAEAPAEYHARTSGRRRRRPLRRGLALLGWVMLRGRAENLDGRRRSTTRRRRCCAPAIPSSRPCRSPAFPVIASASNARRAGATCSDVRSAPYWANRAGEDARAGWSRAHGPYRTIAFALRVAWMPACAGMTLQASRGSLATSPASCVLGSPPTAHDRTAGDMACR